LSRIPEAAINEIRNRADIVSLVARYVELKQAGRNWKGLCPFHNEKTPSFNVNPDRQIFHCFGCQEGGDVIAFLMKHDGLSFPEAARSLASDLGIEIPEERGSAEVGLTTRIFEANVVAQELYREALIEAQGELTRDYLSARGFDAASAEEFEMGFAPASWDAVVERLRKRGISGDLGTKAGLLAERKSGTGHYDRLRGRLTFPIKDVRGRLIGFGGRAVETDQEPKYLNTPETPVFHKRTSFYGYPDALESIRRVGRVILCEGYFDRIAFARAGMAEALATCGTALTAEHGSELRKRAREIVLVFDGDQAGQLATEKALHVLLPHGLRVRAALIPAGMDPDDYLKKEGEEGLRRLVNGAPDALELSIRNAVRQGILTPNEKADAVSRVAPLVARVSDAVSRDEYIRRLALAVGALVPAVSAIVRDASRGAIETPEVDSAALGFVRDRNDQPQERQLRMLARLCLQHPEIVSDEMALKLNDVLPDGAWKAIILQIIEAAAEGRVDALVVESHLDDEARLRLREIAIDDTPLDSERTSDQIFGDLIGWFDLRQLTAREKDLRRRLSDPEADHVALLEERHALLLERRARLGVDSSAKVKKHSETNVKSRSGIAAKSESSQ
jgi:DNA primase